MNTAQTTRGRRKRTQVGSRVGGRSGAARVVSGQESRGGGGADHARRFTAHDEHSANCGKLALKTVAATELRPGDIVIHRGELHPIDHVDRGAGWAWPVASDGAGWAIALGDVVAIMDHAA
jgi:hypothetical protein